MNANAFAATHDALTHLPNEFLFLDRLNQMIISSERGTNLFAVLFIVPSNFAMIHDEQGQALRDQVILQMAERLQNTLREPDTIARKEDNTFAILLPQIENDSALTHLVRRILKALEKPYHIDSYTIHMNFCTGKAMYPYDGTSVQLLMQHIESELEIQNGRSV